MTTAEQTKLRTPLARALTEGMPNALFDEVADLVETILRLPELAIICRRDSERAEAAREELLTA